MIMFLALSNRSFHFSCLSLAGTGLGELITFFSCFFGDGFGDGLGDGERSLATKIDRLRETKRPSLAIGRRRPLSVLLSLLLSFFRRTQPEPDHFFALVVGRELDGDFWAGKDQRQTSNVRPPFLSLLPFIHVLINYGVLCWWGVNRGVGMVTGDQDKQTEGNIRAAKND